jgi:hypothetical protein
MPTPVISGSFTRRRALDLTDYSPLEVMEFICTAQLDRAGGTYDRSRYSVPGLDFLGVLRTFDPSDYSYEDMGRLGATAVEDNDWDHLIAHGFVVGNSSDVWTFDFDDYTAEGFALFFATILRWTWASSRPHSADSVGRGVDAAGFVGRGVDSTMIVMRGQRN